LNITSTVQETKNSNSQGIRIMGSAFPNHVHLPSQLSEYLDVPSIPGHIPNSLVIPKFAIRRGNYFPVSAVVHVPKTSMNKNDFPQDWKNQIRSSWKILSMEDIAKPHPVGHTANEQFRLRILATNRRHIMTALFRGEYVCHE
jgi:hypothetical protein